MNARTPVNDGLEGISPRDAGSLRRRLIAWLLLPMLLLSTALFFDAYRSAREIADRAYDRVIAASVLAIADRVVTVGGQLDVDLPYVALEMLSTEADDRVFYRIADANGSLLTGYQDLPLPPEDSKTEVNTPVFYDAIYRGEEVRVGALSHPITGPGANGQFSLQVAQTRGQRDRLVLELASATAARLALLVVLIGIATWLGVRFGLAPLARLRTAVRARSPRDLRPLELSVPREVRDVVIAINLHMERLRRTLSAMEQFISDAAHQLRTPLAALHTQAELALRETDPEALRASIVELRSTTWRTSRLADQLLNLARSSADAEGLSRETLDLGVVAADVTRELAPAALAKNIDIGFENDAVCAPVNVDSVLIKELVKNLVDNAIRYCSQGATVTVRVRIDANAQRALLLVEDDGPGIAATERARVLERFHRGAGTQQQGSGLGLAIVREVAERHGGEVHLHDSDSGGLLVQVALPLHQPPP